jgi:hypothetical protein
VEAQYFPIYGIELNDLNMDGNLDVLLTGNQSATQPDFGSYDAGVGLILLGDGKANFAAMRPDHSGFVTLGEGRDIAILKRANSNELLYLVARNNDKLLTFGRNKKVK